MIYQNVKLNSIINNSNENLSNEEIYQNIIKSNILNELNVPKGKAIISDDLFPKRNDINKDVFYYNNFILLNKDTLYLLNNNNLKLETPKITYFFKDKKMYMIFNNKKCLEIYNLNQQNYFIPELFLLFDCSFLNSKIKFYH